jgi:hypothetical protein
MGVINQMVGAVTLVVVAMLIVLSPLALVLAGILLPFLLATLFPLLVVCGLVSAIYRAVRDDLGL